MHSYRFFRPKKYALIRLLMVLLVLLPVYGSWLNEDFAAAQPLHGHIYLDGVKLDHHRPPARHAGEHGDHSAETDGVVNIPDQDAAGLGLLLVFVSAAALLLPDLKNGLESALKSYYTLLNGIFPPPLDHPPRI